MAKINPRVEPTDAEREWAAKAQARGGSITAEEMAFTRQWEMKGWTHTKAQAARLAGKDGAIKKSDGWMGGWHFYKPHGRASASQSTGAAAASKPRPR